MTLASKERSQKKKFSRGASSSLGKELGNLQLNQNTVQLREVEDKGPMQRLVQVKVLLLDMEKSQSALIAIEGIWVFVGY